MSPVFGADLMVKKNIAQYPAVISDVPAPKQGNDSVLFQQVCKRKKAYIMFVLHDCFMSQRFPQACSVHAVMNHTEVFVCDAVGFRGSNESSISARGLIS